MSTTSSDTGYQELLRAHTSASKAVGNYLASLSLHALHHRASCIWKLGPWDCCLLHFPYQGPAGVEDCLGLGARRACSSGVHSQGGEKEESWQYPWLLGVAESETSHHTD